MRPGVTGLAQVNGRDLLTAEQKVAYDAYYVEHHTLFIGYFGFCFKQLPLF